VASPGAAVASTWPGAASRRARSSYGGYIAAALASLRTDAGFVDVTVQAVPGMVKFDSIQAFKHGQRHEVIVRAGRDPITGRYRRLRESAG